MPTSSLTSSLPVNLPDQSETCTNRNFSARAGQFSPKVGFCELFVDRRVLGPRKRGQAPPSPRRGLLLEFGEAFPCFRVWSFFVLIELPSGILG